MQPLIFIAFGVTGDLMKQKILPAIAKLQEKDELPKDFKLIGISRRPAVEAAEMFGKNFHHLQGDATEVETYIQLKELLDSLDTEFGQPAQKIFYLSTSPVLYRTIFEHLGSFAEHAKLMVEKPFGLSGTDAKELNEILHKNFSEEQIYRVDHYLGKQSLLKTPYANPRDIQEIVITLYETAGVEKRGTSYDAVGALRDVGQNHMLELLVVLVASSTRETTLEGLHVLSPEEIATQTTHEQYAGYKETPGVAADSQTETAFSITTHWQGIPVTFRAGKHMPENIKTVRITYNNGFEESTRDIARLDAEEREAASSPSPEYEKLLIECVQGEQLFFISEREVELLWRFIDPILKVWYQ